MYYVNLIETLFELLVSLRKKENIILGEIDIGGGFGVAHSSNEQSMDIFDVINKIVNQVEVISKTQLS